MPAARHLCRDGHRLHHRRRGGPDDPEKGRVVPYWHHETWHDDNGSSHIKAALLSPFITVPFVNGKITVGPWQNLTLIECDTRDRVRDIVFQVMGE